MFLFVTAILPLVAGLYKVGRMSDVTERTGYGDMIVYVVIAPLSALFLLSPGFIPAHTKLCLHVENNVSALAAVVYAYNLLLSTRHWGLSPFAPESISEL